MCTNISFSYFLIYFLFSPADETKEEEESEIQLLHKKIIKRKIINGCSSFKKDKDKSVCRRSGRTSARHIC